MSEPRAESSARIQDLFDLSGRVALVTGGSRGLGREAAEALGEAGASVVLAARRVEWLRAAEAAFRAAGIECLAVPCDISRPEAVGAMLEQVVARFAKVDILVNNAGVTWGAPVLEMPLDRWRQVLDTNLTGTFLVTQAVGRLMVERRCGKIINVASIAGLVGNPPDVLDTIGYSTAKGGVVAFTRDLAVKWAPYNVCVNGIAPGFFKTRMTEALLAQNRQRVEAQIPLGRIGRPGDLKGVAVFLASAASDYITGQIIAVDGGRTAV
ncbi:MAG TPA: SDR family oxidoreductase [bacterium]|nr:SDR family oxidoreductase [bacterium]